MTNHNGEKLTDDRKTLLIADDEYVNRAMLGKTFAPYYRVLEAADGMEAMALLRSRKVDAVVLDIVMPRMNGFEVLIAMRADPALAAIPVVIVTGSGDEGSEVRALDYGAQDLINKPFNPDAIVRRVGNLLAQRDAIEAARQSVSRHDELTGLLTRQAFVVEARELIVMHPPGSYEIFCIDVDNFKVINDRFGHTAGDRLLRFISQICASQLDKAGGVACREAADVFLLLLPNDGATFDRVLPQFLRALRSYDLPMTVSVHIGRYVAEDANTDIHLMIDWARMALRSVKGSADRTVGVFSAEMRQQLLRQQRLVDEMRPALEAGQFIPYFQPQFDYESGAMIGAEALVRWNHPQQGLIPPGEFIPLFESNGFIAQLDVHIWDQVCRMQRRWLTQGLSPVPVSVNISRRDFRKLDLPAVLKNLLEKYNLPPSLLHLEITESAFTEQAQELAGAVEALRALGFSVEMDDFGAGYSSLNTLKDVPVDTLKLDMQFIGRDAAPNSRGGRILSSVVRMAHSLRLPVIAEGVETRQQADYLKSIGCLLMQGYLFARPMPAEAYEARLAAGHTAAPPSLGSDEGVVDFLDASTQATLLFNSFVGGAGIAEYDGVRLEFLRLNDQFFQVLGCTRHEYDRLESDLFSHFTPADVETYRQALDEAMHTGRETYCELSSQLLQSDGHPLWTGSHIHFLTRSGTAALFYIAVENITPRVELERRLAEKTAQAEAKISSLREKERIVCIMARHSQRYVVLYDHASDTFAPYDSTVNELQNVLPLYSSPEDYLRGGAIAPESISDVQTCYRALKTGHMDGALKFKARALDDTWRWMDTILSGVYSDDGAPLYAIVSFADITQRYDRELAYQRYKNLLSSSVSQQAYLLDYNLTRNALDDYSPNVPDTPFFVEAQKGFFEYINALGHSFVCPQDRHAFLVFFNRSRLLRAFRGGTANGTLEFMARKPHAEQSVYVRGSYQMVTEPYSSDIRLMFSLEVIDQQKRAELALLERAQTDAVTHVLNRATFTERAKVLLSESMTPCAFAMLDIDHFKHVNDMLGHAEGDELLHDVAQTISVFTREDDLVGRLGGDEFGILFTHITEPGLLRGKLAGLLGDIFRNPDERAGISASIGVSLFPQDAQDFEALYKMADTALYRGKAKGRNQFVFYTADMEAGATPHTSADVEGTLS